MKDTSKDWKKPAPQPFSEAAVSIPLLFLTQAARLGDQPFLWHKPGDYFTSQSYRVIADRAKQLASRLILLGVMPGDRIVLASENRPDWVIADFAILLAGAIPVPAYATNSVNDHRHILSDSGAIGVICSSGQSKKIKSAMMDETLPCRFAITLDQAEDGFIQAWEKTEIQEKEILARVESLRRDDLCCIIYTSGTGGHPKGVMISHYAILSILEGASAILSNLVGGRERFLNFLPLSHAYEHVVGLFWPVALGAEIYFASSLDRLLEDMNLVKPTLMTAVPRLYEVIHQRMERQLCKATPLQQKLFRITQSLGRKREAKMLHLWEYPVDWLMEFLIRRKIRAKFGGHLKAFVSGGAALNPEIGRYFLSLGICIFQGYGQTEASPVISVNLPYRNKIESVGPPLPGVEVKLSEDNEILVQGPNLMMGYWNDDEATKNAIREGWLHTGDLGALDKDGHLYIVGRKKDIIVLTGGDTISPAKIEQELCCEPEIEQALVEGKTHLVALIVPHQTFATAWACKHPPAKDDLGALTHLPAFRQTLGDAVERVNLRLGQNEKIRRFVLLDKPFTIENQMLTPTLKIRRHVIRQSYKTLLDSLF